MYTTPSISGIMFLWLLKLFAATDQSRALGSLAVQQFVPPIPHTASLHPALIPEEL